MTVIFKAKTQEGHIMKILAELLKNNVQEACFQIDESGINLRVSDSNRTIVIDLQLDSENFNKYRFRADDKLFVSLNLSHLHKMLKIIKKNDSIEFSILEENPNEFFIKIIPQDNNACNVSTINILKDYQNFDDDLPPKEEYNNPILIPSKDYQKMIKDMVKIDPTVKIYSEDYNITFTCDAGGIMKRIATYGESESDDESDDEKNSYSDEFNTEQLSRIAKIAGFCPNIQIYTNTELPILFRSKVGLLGNISIYMKSKEQIQNTPHEDDY